jgi:hypothetical protein
MCKHEKIIVDYLHPHGDIQGVPLKGLQASDPNRTRPIMTLMNFRCADCGKSMHPRELGLRLKKGGDLYDQRFKFK